MKRDGEPSIFAGGEKKRPSSREAVGTLISTPLAEGEGKKGVRSSKKGTDPVRGSLLSGRGVLAEACPRSH